MVVKPGTVKPNSHPVYIHPVSYCLPFFMKTSHLLYPSVFFCFIALLLYRKCRFSFLKAYACLLTLDVRCRDERLFPQPVFLVVLAVDSTPPMDMDDGGGGLVSPQRFWQSKVAFISAFHCDTRKHTTAKFPNIFLDFLFFYIKTKSMWVMSS